MFKPIKIIKIIEFLRSKQDVYFTQEELSQRNHSTLTDSHINSFSQNENSFKLLFDVSETKILSVSNHVEAICGYSESEILKGDLSLILDALTVEHFLFPYVWGKWITDIYAETGNLDDLKITICGVKIKHKNGQILTGLIQYSPVDILNNTVDGVSKTAALTITEISHLIKSDFYWMRAEFGLTDKQRHHLFSTNNKNIPYDIISDREKDVLRLIAQGMESKEIGETLFISIHTVNNHRRNMIFRTGARDTTALIQICKMSGII
jgi:DNA-binding CsgD family transcriptional regulator